MKKIGIIFALFLSIIIVGGCGDGNKTSEKDPITTRIETEYSQFNNEYNKVSGVESILVKKLYESNRNTQYAYVNDLLIKIQKNLMY